jgi:hypothetical protein
MQISELSIFDLDDTILRIPSYTSKKFLDTYLGHTYLDTPYSFYDNEVSLDESIFDIYLIEPVVSAWREAYDNDKSAPILITHRSAKLEEQITDLLAKRGILFDKSYFLGRKIEKIEVLDQLLSGELDLEYLTRIKIFEDSIDQIFKYQQYFKSKNLAIDIEYWIVDKSRVFKISEVSLTNKQKIKLI